MVKKASPAAAAAYADTIGPVSFDAPDLWCIVVSVGWRLTSQTCVIGPFDTKYDAVRYAHGRLKHYQVCRLLNALTAT